MTRTSANCAAASPEPTSATAMVVIVERDQSIHIQGSMPCELHYRITDYGGVGSITDVATPCTFQPPGMQWGGGQFAPRKFTIDWALPSTDAGSPLLFPDQCFVTDTWTLNP
jgi:hypothetical protein